MYRIVPFCTLLLLLPPVHAAADDLVDAVKRSDTTAVRELVKSGAAIDKPTGEKGRTPLQYAARAGNVDIVRLLLDAGAQVNFQDVRGSTALHIAVQNQHADIVRLLVERGADARLPNLNGRSAAQKAQQRAREEPDNPRRQDIAAYLAKFNRNYSSRPGGQKSLVKRGKMAPPVVIALSQDIAPREFTGIARSALVSRGWHIESETGDALLATYTKFGETYKVQIRNEAGSIRIGYVKHFHTDRDKWLRFLERDIRGELGSRARP